MIWARRVMTAFPTIKPITGIADCCGRAIAGRADAIHDPNRTDHRLLASGPQP
jgi:hypothetical protein